MRVLFIGLNLVAGLILYYSVRLDNINQESIDLDNSVKVYITKGKVA